MDFLRNKEHNTPANNTTNRDYLVNHVRATDMKVANTYYQKPDKLKGTYQRKDNVNGGPPWNTDRYCELDHCMVKKQWMNSITNIQADPYTNINTDRKVFEIKIRQKLKARTQPNREPTLKGIMPEKDGKTREEAIEEYSKFRELVEEEWETEGMEVGQLYKLTEIAARHAFNKPRTRGKRQDCDARLRRIIDDRKTATMRHDDTSVKRPTRELRRLGRKTKLEKLLSELRDNKWDLVRKDAQKRIYTQTHQAKRHARQTST